MTGSAGMPISPLIEASGQVSSTNWPAFCSCRCRATPLVAATTVRPESPLRSATVTVTAGAVGVASLSVTAPCASTCSQVSACAPPVVARHATASTTVPIQWYIRDFGMEVLLP
jgi:hypothetical protein